MNLPDLLFHFYQEKFKRFLNHELNSRYHTKNGQWIEEP